MKEDNTPQSLRVLLTGSEDVKVSWPTVIRRPDTGSRSVVRSDPTLVAIHELEEFYSQENLDSWYQQDTLAFLASTGHDVIVGVVDRTPRVMAMLGEFVVAGVEVRWVPTFN